MHVCGCMVCDGAGCVGGRWEVGRHPVAGLPLPPPASPAPPQPTSRPAAKHTHASLYHTPFSLHVPPLPRSRTCNVLDEHCVPADRGGMTHIIVSAPACAQLLRCSAPTEGLIACSARRADLRPGGLPPLRTAPACLAGHAGPRISSRLTTRGTTPPPTTTSTARQSHQPTPPPSLPPRPQVGCAGRKLTDVSHAQEEWLEYAAVRYGYGRVTVNSGFSLLFEMVGDGERGWARCGWWQGQVAAGGAVRWQGRAGNCWQQLGG